MSTFVVCPIEILSTYIVCRNKEYWVQLLFVEITKVEYLHCLSPKNIDNIVCTLNKYWAPLLLVQIKNIEVLALSLNNNSITKIVTFVICSSNKDWVPSLFFPIKNIEHLCCLSQWGILSSFVCVPIKNMDFLCCLSQ